MQASTATRDRGHVGAVQPARRRRLQVKPDWLPLLHEARRREIDVVFRRVPPGAFERGLELGAGDGFQSRLLVNFCQRLISTDLNESLLPVESTAGIEYRVLDAEAVGTAFAPAAFDLVFSSNLLEHLPDVQRCLRGVARVLKDDGVAVHIMPSVLWKVNNIVCYPLDLVARNVDLLLSREGRQRRLEMVRRLARRAPAGAVPRAEYDNNLKVTRTPRSRWRRALLPEPHGVSTSHLEELRAFSRRRWEREFRSAGFDVVAVRKGPVTSGYGFGWERVRLLAERLGLTTEHVYVTVKRGRRSPSIDWFPG
jgi:SAM-dependent methyltransferase